MKITKSQLRELIREELQTLKEAEEVSFSDLDKSSQDMVQRLLKLFNKRQPVAIFDGIHGKILMIENDQHGSNSYRFDLNEIKQLSKLKIRWVTGGVREISIGF